MSRQTAASGSTRSRGRHKAVRPDQIGRALRRALTAAALPALLLAAAAFVVWRTAADRVRDLLLDPAWLLVVVIAMGVVWLGWMLLIFRTYDAHRSSTASVAMRTVGVLCVLVLCGAITAPMAVGARYALVTREVIGTVFDDQASATTPTVTEKDPWDGQKRVNVLLLGGDGAVHRPGVRTDSVMLASIEVGTGDTVLFSLPRNLRDVPFKAGSKLAEIYPNGFTGSGNEAEYFLNAIYRNVPAVHPGVLGKTDNEGADAVKLAVSGALGLRVDYYVLVNLGGFRQLVDAIGGITVNINEPVPIGGNTDAGIRPDDYLQPGPDQRLDGFKALWYTRGRYGSTDYKRMERQRCAINAIVAEASPAKVLRRYTKLAQASKDIVRTDIPRKLLPDFVDLAAKVKGASITSVGFERSDEFDPNDPDFDFVRQAVRRALGPGVPASVPVSGTGAGAGAVPATGDAARTGTAAGGVVTTQDAVPSRPSRTADDCAYRPAS